MYLTKRPWFLFFIPKGFWVTVTPNVYYPEGTDLSLYLHVVAHENTHLRQQVLHNKYIWFLKYIFIPSFRLQMEAEAMGMEAYILTSYYRETAEFIANNQLSNAQALAAWDYLWCTDVNTASAAIEAHKQLLISNPPTFDPCNYILPD